MHIFVQAKHHFKNHQKNLNQYHIEVLNGIFNYPNGKIVLHTSVYRIKNILFSFKLNLFERVLWQCDLDRVNHR